MRVSKPSLTTVLVVLVWTICMGASLAWSLVAAHRSAVEMAKLAAKWSHDKDVLYRRWVTSVGGVYVEVSDAVPPSPFLAHIPERDVKTPSGRMLTLMNPAYMSRQVHALGAGIYAHPSHITSAKPLNPLNRPDEWEARALERFALGVDSEISELTKEPDGSKSVRYMRAMRVEAGCLKCHAAQGYKVGDLRGGISVRVPVGTYGSIQKAQVLPLYLGHGTIYVLGLIFLLLGLRQLRQHIFREHLFRAARLSSLGTFAQGMGHEIRNPLAIIKGNLELISDELEGERRDEGRLKDFLTRQGIAVERIRGVLDQIDRLTPEARALPEINDLNGLLEQVIQKARSASGVARQALRLKLTTEPLPVWSGDQDLSFVFLSILWNAVQAVTGASVKEPQISVETSREGAKAVLKIKDNGPGIDPKFHDRLFDPFFTTRGPKEGKGLGLSVSHAIVTAAGGTIEVASTLGNGATIIVRLPLVKSEA